MPLELATHTHTQKHTDTHIYSKPTVSTATHIHTHAPPNSVVEDRVVCDELYVSTRLLKVNFLKTAAHWRGEEMIGDGSKCVCVCACV